MNKCWGGRKKKDLDSSHTGSRYRYRGTTANSQGLIPGTPSGPHQDNVCFSVLACRESGCRRNAAVGRGHMHTSKDALHKQQIRASGAGKWWDDWCCYGQGKWLVWEIRGHFLGVWKTRVSTWRKYRKESKWALRSEEDPSIIRSHRENKELPSCPAPTGRVSSPPGQQTLTTTRRHTHTYVLYLLSWWVASSQ